MALDRLTKVDGGGISTTSDYRVGIITASKFVGPFDGSGGNFSGVVTATNGVFSGNISAVDGNFSGNVTIGGTLTYEDVTNIDSVGIITAAKDIHVGAGVSAIGVGTFSGLDISGDIDVDGHTNLDNISIAGVTTVANDTEFIFGSNATATRPLKIKHQSSNTRNQFTANYIDFNITDARFKKIGTSDQIAQFFTTGVNLFYNGTERLSTAAAGAKVHGNLMIESNQPNILFIDENADNDFSIKCDGGSLQFVDSTDSYTTRMSINSSGNVSIVKDLDVDGHTNLDNISVAGVTTMSGALIAEGNYIEIKGTMPYLALTDTNSNPDYSLFNLNGVFSIYDGTNSANRLTISSSGNVSIPLDLDVDGHTELDNLNVAGVSTYTGLVDINGGATVNGGLTSTLLTINGGASPATINHTGGNALTLARGGKEISFNANYAASNSYAVMSVTSGMDFRFTVGGRDGITIDGSNGYMGIDTQAPTAPLHIASNSAALKITRGTKTFTFNANYAAGDSYMLAQLTSGMDLKFNLGGSDKIVFKSAGHIEPETAGAMNIGSASKEIGDVYIADNKRLYFGSNITSSDKSEIYNDGNDLFINHTEAGYLQLQGNYGVLIQRHNGTENMITALSNGAVSLFYDQSSHATAKLATTATGVSVHGEVAASQDYPNIRPTLDINFSASKALDPRIKFYRNSTATSINEHGLVSYSGINEPRFDHDVTTRQSKGLLIEPNLANWIRYSTNLEGSGWGTNNTTNTLALDVVAPDGTTGSVYENMENSSNAYHALHYSASIPVTSGQYYTISSWVKRGPNYRTDINSGNYQFYCSRGTGSVATVSISSDFKSIISHSNTVDRSITLFPNDWVRVTYSFQSNQNSSNVTPHWLHGNGGSYLGNGTSSVYVWGCQFEQLIYPTSYIPTDKGNVIYRGAEHCVIDGTDFSDFYNPLESSVYVDGIMNVPTSYAGQYNILNVGDSNNDGHGIFRENGTKDVWYHIRNNNSTPSGGNLNPSGFGDWDRGEEARIAIAFKDGDQAISVNGGNQVTATVTSSYPTANITKMWIGSAGSGGSGQFSGTIGRIMYYPKMLTDNQLNTITS